MATERPPLDLFAELVFPDGTTKRWDADQPLAKDQPMSTVTHSARYEGWADSRLTLARRIDIDYPDLGLLDGINIIGYDGSVAHEGRITSMPRSMSTEHSVGVLGQGWMGHAKDESFTELYVDRDLSKWVAPAAQRVANLLAANWSLGSSQQLLDEAGVPSVSLDIEGNWVSPYKPLTEAWWLPQAGIELGALYYDFAQAATTMSGADLNWGITASLSSDDHGSATDSSANLWPTIPSAGYLTATGPRASALLQLAYGATPAGAQGATFYARFAKLALYGTHGLTRQGEDPGGFFVSDMIKNIAARWTPKLDTSGVQGTTLPIPQAAILSETWPYDAWQTLNAYHRWEMNVYQGRRLEYRPIELTDWDWEVRLSDPGTTVELQGDDSSSLINGVIVRYTDLTTGYETRLTPESHSPLADPSPDNPVNANGLRIYTTLSLSVPTTEEVAVEVGRIYLAEFNQTKSPGSITITGHIRDRAGHWQQGWKVKASDRLIISDLPNDLIRVVGETEWNNDTKTLTIAVDASFKRLDAILARLGVAVEASGLSLP
jgi:hypothetical protein